MKYCESQEEEVNRCVNSETCSFRNAQINVMCCAVTIQQLPIIQIRSIMIKVDDKHAQHANGVTNLPIKAQVLLNVLKSFLSCPCYVRLQKLIINI